MQRYAAWIGVLLLSVSATASANQVQPPPPPPAPTTPAPAPTPAPDPTAPLAPPADPSAPHQVPAPPPAYAPNAPPPPPPGNTNPPPTQATVQWQASTAATSGPSEGDRAHDGFFFRGALGFGYSRWSEDVGSDSAFVSTFEATGVGVGIDLALGVVLVENLALHLSIFGTGVTDPEVSFDGEPAGTAEDSSLTGTGVGLGLTYYVMPANVYFSGALGVGNATLTLNRDTEDEVRVETDSGIALELMVGKEWWVSSEWGLGVALQLVHVNVPDGDARLRGTGVHIMFSATYN